jgi:HlyD family secretion protein
MNQSEIYRRSEAAIALGLDAARRRLGTRPLVAAIVAMVLGAALTAHALLAPPPLSFATQKVRRGDLQVSVTATGTLQPRDEVEIGVELSGTIRTVDVAYNDVVHAGQTLARLDTARLEAQLLQSRAALDSAHANAEQARASRVEAESQLARLESVRVLSGGKIPSPQELTSGKAAVERAHATEASAQAAVEQAEATLAVQQTDLDKADIRSPIDGVVLTAAVRPGQTVAASLQAPVLFTLARDLGRLDLDMAVDEADVGQVHEGQVAHFAVDAWPGRRFEGRVTQVRYASHTVGGVVTYEAILSVDNPDLALRPGMTATAQIDVRRDANVLLVPNAALRFEPPAHAVARRDGGLLASLGHRGKANELTRPSDEQSHGPRVWVERGGAIAAVPVETGASDGTWTEIPGDVLEPDERVAVDVASGA